MGKVIQDLMNEETGTLKITLERAALVIGTIVQTA
jgi:hypothetical protein